MSDQILTPDSARLAAITRTAEARRDELRQAAASKQADLPLRFLQQQAHFTTPASNLKMAQKAIEGGWGKAPQILEKLGISFAELSDIVGVREADVEELLQQDSGSPLVMVDGEDAQALRDDVVLRGRENAVTCFREAAWGRTLRFYRPSGLGLNYCIDDLVKVLTEAGRGLPVKDYPVDGIIWPKAEHPDELRWVSSLLGQIEEACGLEQGHIKMQFLIESGYGLWNLPALADACMDRLSGLIFGIADYAADIHLPHIVNDHPVCDVARGLIVNMAGAVGVPAIDNMTVNYPVADKNLSATENRSRILGRLKECFDDARHGMNLGMDGKWVGHPLQCFMVMLAYSTALPREEVEAEVAKIEAYNAAVAAEQGATIIDGVMSDRATDRHARNKLRKAVAIGKLAPEKAAALGLITEDELAGFKG